MRTGFEVEAQDRRDLPLDDWDDPANPDHQTPPRPAPPERKRCGRKAPRPGGLRGFQVCPQWLDVHGDCPECDRPDR